MPAPPDTGYSFLASEAARLIDQFSEPDKQRAFVVVYEMSKGLWPVMPHPPPDPPGGTHTPPHWPRKR